MLEANSASTGEKSVLSAYSNQEVGGGGEGLGILKFIYFLECVSSFRQFAFLFNLSILLFELD